jgi:CRP/FNR family transcriptional regulator
MESIYIKEEIPALLRKHYPMLVEPDLQAEIAEVGILKEVPAGEIIMDYGDHVRMIPLIIEGSVKVLREDEDGNELFLYYLGNGETCSMTFSCCMVEKQSEIRTITEEDTWLIGIPVKYMSLWMNRFPSWKNFVMISYDQRMYELVRTIDNIAFKKMDERLWDYLQKKSAASGKSTIHTTHQAIAYDLNASREAVSRLLKQLEKQGKVKLGRNEIVLD